MTAITQPPAAALDPAIATALQRIPPLWPLGHFVAVNPFAGLSGLPFTGACALLQRTVGTVPLLPPAAYLALYEEGAINDAHLDAVADDPGSAAALVEALRRHGGAATGAPIPTVADLLDRESPHAHWSVFIAEEISKWCAVALDDNQTIWRFPWRDAGLYAGWRSAALFDGNPEAFGLAGFRAFVAELPGDADAAIAHCLQRLGRHEADPTDFLHRQLASVAGWAGYAQYLRREAQMRGDDPSALRDLLAIRLAYDAALHDAHARDEVFARDWPRATKGVADETLIGVLARWQLAYELGHQQELARALCAQPSHRPAARPEFQAVFCIDVRSEVLRRHLEAAAPDAQTLGFGGFFGFPISHRAADADVPTARCPVLLVPPISTIEAAGAGEVAAARARRARSGAWKAFQNSAASCFSFVETAGLAFAAVLGRNHDAGSCGCAGPAPEWTTPAGDATASRAAVAFGALNSMGLTQNFARLVLFCGHGSQSANNPYASALDCGACGGHAGNVNARLAAATLNDPGVRACLADRGILVPDDTWFLAGLHNTATDEIMLFDVSSVPASHAADLAALRRALETAGAAAARERAAALGLANLPATRLPRSLRARAADPSEVRPEWGLANNAALVAAPRSRTAALHLHGRVFLHDYDAASDRDLSVLTLILSAPVVVASWINLQYYASRVDPGHYGSGNKTLHNVAGGIGVVEGNGGDLRTGLPLQSLHDGRAFLHEPRRLSVFVEAAPDALTTVLAAQPAVRELFDHGWIHLFALVGDRCLRYRADGWSPVS